MAENRSNLESLVVTGSYHASSEVGPIKKNYRKLNSICLSGCYDADIAGIASLLTSYGTQLDYARLLNMNDDQLRTVGDACANSRFHLQASRAPFPVTGLNLLAPRVDAVTIWLLNSEVYNRD